MDTLLFSVYDQAAERFLDPFVAPTHAVAIRGFEAAIGKQGHPFQEYPQDYTLFQIGSFDAESGQLVPITPHSLGNGVQFIGHGEQLSIDGRREAAAIQQETVDA